MGATIPAPQSAGPSVILSRKHDTSSSVCNGNKKSSTKVNIVIDLTESHSSSSKALPESIAPSPSLEPSSQPDDGEPSESEEEGVKPVYDYKVIQHLNIPGHTFENLEKTKVIGTFDDLKKAEDAAWQQYELTAVLSGSRSSLASDLDGMRYFVIHHREGQGGSRIEVQKEVRKPQALRKVYLVRREDRRDVARSNKEDVLEDMSIVGIFRDLKSAIKCLKQQPKEVDKMEGIYEECESRFERQEWEEGGMPFLMLLDSDSETLLKFSIFSDYLY